MLTTKKTRKRSAKKLSEAEMRRADDIAEVLAAMMTRLNATDQDWRDLIALFAR